MTDDGITAALAPIEVEPASPFPVYGRPLPTLASLRAVNPDVDALCRCVGVEIGKYANQVTLDVPAGVDIRFNAPGREPKRRVSVDACLADEIKHLWSLGIVTTGCCCGHNKVAPYIGVEERFIPRMKALGYQVRHNPCRPGDEDSFRPKSLIATALPTVDPTGRYLDSTGYENTFDG